jgi:hypothetical protein
MHIFAATLQIMDASEADDGSYECIVENPVGMETSSNARLYVKGNVYSYLSLS